MPTTPDIKRLARYVTLWRVIAPDGSGVDVTTGTREVTVDGVSYSRATLRPSDAQQVANLDLSNLEVALALGDAVVTVEELEGGKWDGARVEIRIYDWLNDEVVETWRGVLSRAVHDNGRMKAEVLDLAVLFQQPVGDLYQELCRADHGDEACGRNPAAHPGLAITSFVGRDEFVVTLTEPRPDYFVNGKVEFTSGANAGREREIRSVTQEGADLRVRLSAAAVYAVAPGDVVTLREGCAKTMLACIERDNALRNRSEYGIPGRNQLMRWPD